MNNLFYSKYHLILLTAAWLVGCTTTRQGAEAYFKSGSIKSQQGNYKGAMKDFGRVLKINPRYAKAYLGRSNIKYNLKNYQGAIEDYTRAIEINESEGNSSANQSIYYSRGNAYAAIGEPGKGLDDFEKMRTAQ